MSKDKPTIERLEEVEQYLSVLADCVKLLRRSVVADECELERRREHVDSLRDELRDNELEIMDLKDKVDALRKGDR
jgi:uncharacterized coiled-coil protein SlyX